jgi:hypothetical protein
MKPVNICPSSAHLIVVDLISLTILCEIWGYLGGDYEDYCLLGCDDVPSDRYLPRFRRKVPHPSSGFLRYVCNHPQRQ